MYDGCRAASGIMGSWDGMADTVMQGEFSVGETEQHRTPYTD